MTTLGSAPRYCAYILRCWDESTDDADAGNWRFSLEDVHTGARYGFASFAGLMTFLHKQYFDGPDTNERTAAVDEIE